jgi:hypothetical protein
MGHCEDLSSDRGLGEYWERQFCKMAARCGFWFTPMQIGRNKSAQAYSRNGQWASLTLPDITVWTFPGQHHEIKHKNPTKHGSFGLERYRLNALLEFSEETHQDVMYTIHNHDLSGGRMAKRNDIAHWITVNVKELDGTWTFEGRFPSWVNGSKKKVLQYFWPITYWRPLKSYWLELMGDCSDNSCEGPISSVNLRAVTQLGLGLL